MRRRATHYLTALSCVAWLGCAEEDTTATTSTSSSSSGTGGTNPTGMGGNGGTENFGGDTSVGGGVCIATSEKAEPTPLDIIFVVDWSHGMEGPSWEGTTAALQTFFEDPASDGISAGIVYLPSIKPAGQDDPCNRLLYESLDVPIAPLPDNAFALTNSMPENALGHSTPVHAALSGAIMAATAYQDAHLDHKVILVVTGDGDSNVCGAPIEETAQWLADGLEYNGVRTYVIAVESTIFNLPNLEILAQEGGTGTYYDAQDIDQFSAQMADIRTAALGCDFAIPPPPDGEALVPNKVNFTYTPGGSDMPITLPRADDLEDCGGEPGWYYDNNQHPTKVIICPASCATIQNDTGAEVAVEFGCGYVAN